MSALTWEEFVKTVRKGDVFQFFPNETKDLASSFALTDAIGERCTATNDPLNYEGVDTFVEFKDHKNHHWAFYGSNSMETKALYRILETSPKPSPPGLVVGDIVEFKGEDHMSAWKGLRGEVTVAGTGIKNSCIKLLEGYTRPDGSSTTQFWWPTADLKIVEALTF